MKRKTKMFLGIFSLLMFLAAVVMPVAAKADNTTLVTARSVPANQWVADTLGTASARYYKVDVPAKGTIRVEFKRTVGSAVGKSWIVVLMGYKADKDKYDTLASDSFNCTQPVSHYLPRIGVEKGTFYLKVEKGVNPDKSLEYQFRLVVDNASDWETEFNDGFETADSLTVTSGTTTTVHGNTRMYSGKTAEKDYYTFQIPKPGYVQMSLKVAQNLNKFAHWTAYLYDANGKQWMYFSCDNKDRMETDSPRIGLPAGRYYIAASTLWSSPSNADYQLDVFYMEMAGWESELNDSYNDADAVSTEKIFSGSVMSGSDRDCYRLAIPYTGRYRLDFRYGKNMESKKTWLVTLEDQSGTRITGWTFREKDDPKKTAAVTLNKGTYYLWIKGGDSWSPETYLWSFNRYIAPASLKKVSNTAKGLKITWNGSADAQRYILQRRTDISSWKDVTSTKQKSWVDTTATVNGKRYRYRVIAEADGIRSNASSDKRTWRLKVPSIRGCAAGQGKITVTWNPNNKADGYQIQIARNSGFTNSPKTVKVSKASTKKYVFKNLKRKAGYYVRVRAWKSSTGYVSEWSKVWKVITK